MKTPRITFIVDTGIGIRTQSGCGYLLKISIVCHHYFIVSLKGNGNGPGNCESRMHEEINDTDCDRQLLEEDEDESRGHSETA